MQDPAIPPAVSEARDLLAGTADLTPDADAATLMLILTRYRHALRALLVYAWPTI